MPSARSLIKTLWDHWPTIESICLRSRDLSYLDGDVLQKLALQHANQDPQMAREIVRTLISKGLLIQVGPADEYQVHAPTRDYVLSLCQEHALGLAESIQVEVQEMDRLANEIQQALGQKDISAMQVPLTKLGQRIQSMSRQLEHDQQAILNIADRAKTMPVGTTLEQRYREVIDSFDRYIEPMNQLLQTESSGFAALTERIEDQLLQAERIGEKRGVLSSHKRRFQYIGYALRRLRFDAREKLARSTEVLLPLRDEYLRNSALAVAVAKLTGKVRKRGIHAVFKGYDLKLGGNTRAHKIFPGRFIKDCMAHWSSFEPKPVVFPVVEDGAAKKLIVMQFETILKDLTVKPKSIHLMAWLKNQYTGLSDSEILKFYYEIVLTLDVALELESTPQTETLGEHRVHYYPHKV
jgi:hypothetical protein